MSETCSSRVRTLQKGAWNTCRKKGTFPPPHLWARAATKGAQCGLPKSAKRMDVRRECICTLIMTAREF